MKESLICDIYATDDILNITDINGDVKSLLARKGYRNQIKSFSQPPAIQLSIGRVI